MEKTLASWGNLITTTINTLQNPHHQNQHKESNGSSTNPVSSNQQQANPSGAVPIPSSANTNTVHEQQQQQQVQPQNVHDKPTNNSANAPNSSPPSTITSPNKEPTKEATEHKNETAGPFASLTSPKPDPKREAEFAQLFNMPPTEKLIEDFSCALQKAQSSIIVHGRLYISENYLCFYSNMFGVTTKTIPLLDIEEIIKSNTAILFPNAIEIATTDKQRYFFTSFLFRNQAFQSIQMACEQARGKHPASKKEDEEKKNDEAHAEVNESSHHTDEDEVEETDDEEGDAGEDNSLMEEEDDDDEDDDEEEEEVESELPENKQRSHSDSSKRDKFPYGSLDEPVSRGKERASLKLTRRRSQSFTEKDLKSSVPDLQTSLLKSSSLPQNEQKSSEKIEAAASAAVNNTNGHEQQQHSAEVPSSAGESDSVIPPVSEKCSHFLAEDVEEWYHSENFAVSVSEFFQLLLSDKSDFWMNVHHLVNYTENTVTPWSVEESKCCITRQLNFVAPVTAKIGPKSARMVSVHRCRYKYPDCMVFEAQSISKGIPYADAFTLVNRFQVTKDPKKNGCILQISSVCKFTKNVWGMKGMIERTALESAKEFCLKWCSAARDFIDGRLAKPTAAASSVKSPSHRKAKTKKGVRIQQPQQSLQSQQPLPAHPAPQEAAAAPKATSGSPSSLNLLQLPTSFNEVSWLQVIVCGVVVLFVLSMYWRISSLESQLNAQLDINNRLEERIDTLQHVVQQLSESATGLDNGLRRTLQTTFAEWRKQLNDIEMQLNPPQQ